MIKLFLSSIAVLTLSTSVMAQGVDLFPELQGQFKPAPSMQTSIELQEEAPVQTKTVVTEPQFGSYTTSIKNEMNTSTQENAETFAETQIIAEQKAAITTDPFAVNKMENPGAPAAEGNIKVSLTNLKGVLPYARDFAYCFGDLILSNETNQKLESLTMELIYRDTPTIISFGAVDKKKTQKQALMLIGEACEDILSVPQVEVKSCKMPLQSENSCKKRVQFIPPNS